MLISEKIKQLHDKTSLPKSKDKSCMIYKVKYNSLNST